MAESRSVSFHSFIIHYSAFTLIEMLTVIAIIGVLAAILLPTLSMVRRKARMTTAKSDLKALELALQQYNQDFGAYPPDSNAGLPDTNGPSSGDFTDMDSPNECLVWYLTREFSKSASAAGRPHAGSGWTPATSGTVFARVTGGPYYDVKTKQRRDYDSDDFDEFVDPWGRPYMYHAYADSVYSITSVSHSGGKTIYTCPGIEMVRCTECNWYGKPGDLVGGQCPDCGKPVVSIGIANAIGEVTIRDCVADNNGTFAFEGASLTTFRVLKTSGSNEGSPSVDAEAQFRLHNRETCDLYSLGPNGRTRAAVSPAATGEWQPQGQYDHWALVWGTPGDGNDVEKDGNLGIAAEKDRDDVNNW